MSFGSDRLNRLSAYAFAAIQERVADLTARGLAPVDFGVGDPTLPTPDLIRRACVAGIEEHRGAGYPPYRGTAGFRRAVAEWTERRFGITLDPEMEVCSSIGSKEAIFNFPEAILNPGDIALVPDPGYPPYARGTLFAEGVVHPLPILGANDFLPDLEAIPDDVAARAKIFWLTHPNSPSGKVAPPEFLKRWIEWCRERNIIAASDEAYSEIYFGDPPHTALEYGREGVVVFQSLSKRSAMTGYRIGWVAGDPAIVKAFEKVKTNVDSGTPFFIQEAGIAALSDESHVEGFRAHYRKLRDRLVDAFERAGCPRCEPEATLYIWQKAPEGMTSLQFAERLLDPKISAVTTPSSLLRSGDAEEPLEEAYVRLSLVPSIEDCERVAAAIESELVLS